jgi:outer membrane protein assembly factor BamA
MVLLNAELRVPFLDYMKLAFPLPLELGAVKGVLFLDVGGAWNPSDEFTPVEEGGHFYRLKDLKAGFGAGMRLSLGFASLKFDIAKKTDFYDISSETFYYFTIGTDF